METYAREAPAADWFPHPGEHLRTEWLEPLNMTPYRLARSIGVRQSRIEEILDGKRAISPDTALRLWRFFGPSPHFWLNLQSGCDLYQSAKRKAGDYSAIQPCRLSHPEEPGNAALSEGLNARAVRQFGPRGVPTEIERLEDLLNAASASQAVSANYPLAQRHQDE